MATRKIVMNNKSKIMIKMMINSMRNKKQMIYFYHKIVRNVYNKAIIIILIIKKNLFKINKRIHSIMITLKFKIMIIISKQKKNSPLKLIKKNKINFQKKNLKLIKVISNKVNRLKN